MRWFRGLFGKKRNALPPVPDSVDTWAPGDLAECVDPGPWYRFTAPSEAHSNGPTCGDTRIVAGVTIYETGSGPAQFLSFERWGGHRFAACAFRKITPRADETGIADADFVRKLKRVNA